MSVAIGGNVEEEKKFGYQIREAGLDEWEEAMALAWRTFMKFESKDYPEEGIQSFSDFISDNTLFRMFQLKSYRLFVALEGTKIVGIISVRSRTHISLLFVDEKYHHHGIGSALMHYLWRFLKREGFSFCTVNAAPYAVGFYHKLGFEDTNVEQLSDGIIFTPMKVEFDKVLADEEAK